MLLGIVFSQMVDVYQLISHVKYDIYCEGSGIVEENEENVRVFGSDSDSFDVMHCVLYVIDVDDHPHISFFKL